MAGTEEIGMRILVDADACPVIYIIEETARRFELPVILLCDTNHFLVSPYSEVKVIGAGADAVDFALVNLCCQNDIVVTQDYGVAAMILGKGAYGIHQSGKWYTNQNIDQMLMERHLAKKARRSKGRNHIKGPSKRTEEDDRRFAQSLEALIKKSTEKEKISCQKKLKKVLTKGGSSGILIYAAEENSRTQTK